MKSSLFRRHSLGSELSLWWCAVLGLLLFAVISTGYRAVEGTLVRTGGERADVAAQELAQIFGRSSQLRADQIAAVANDDAIRDYVRTPAESYLAPAQARMRTLAAAVPYHIAVWNTAGQMLCAIDGPVNASGTPPSVVFPADVPPTGLGVNPLAAANGVVIYRNVAPIVERAGLPGDSSSAPISLGYLVVRAIVGDPSGEPAVTATGVIGRLLGTEAKLAIGNTTGDVWTDLRRMVPAPPVDTTHDWVTEYEGPDGKRRVGAIGIVPGTPWAVWVEFPRTALLAPARAWLRDGILLGTGCLLLGALLVTTLTSRLVRPLGELAQAAQDITAGNYTRRVAAGGRNEIGHLADSFNVMTGRVEMAYRQLQHANNQTQIALEAARMAVWEVDLDSEKVTWSPAMAAVYGLTAGPSPRNIGELLAVVHPDDRPMVRDALAARRDRVFEFRVVWPDRQVRWVNSHAKIYDDEHHAPARFLGVSVDITERKTLEESLFVEKERAQVTLQSIGDGVISTDLAGKVTFLNAVAEALTGWSSGAAAGRPLLEVFNIIDMTTRLAADDPCRLAVQRRAVTNLGVNCLLIRRDGSESPIEDSAAPIHDRTGGITGAVIVFRDVSEERAMAQKMAHLAQYDILTDLPNRTLLDDRIAQAIVKAQRDHTQLALLFVDLDRFKFTNDSLGHATGDELLRAVTARLLSSVRASDTVSRRGGDEFVVLLTHLRRADDAAVAAAKILTALALPHEIGGHVLNVTASVGISIYPDDGAGPDELISAADVAMYHAKENGRNTSQFFTSEMNARRMARHSLEGSLGAALSRQEFELHYQPRYDLATGRMTCFEALLRWRHPSRGLVPPTEFVPVAEECGLIVPIGQWVLREACRQMRAWQDQGLTPQRVGVNVSGIEFSVKGFVNSVSAALDETGLAPLCLEFEVTESVLMADTALARAALFDLKDLGIKLAIDDFGTGYSSLSYLSRFPIDTVKIDKSFVQGMTVVANDAAIITAVIGMSRSLNHYVVAEGVETSEQLSALRQLSCGEGQGYYFSKPVPARQFAALLQLEIPETFRTRLDA